MVEGLDASPFPFLEELMVEGLHIPKPTAVMTRDHTLNSNAVGWAVDIFYHNDCFLLPVGLHERWTYPPEHRAWFYVEHCCTHTRAIWFNG